MSGDAIIYTIVVLFIGIFSLLIWIGINKPNKKMLNKYSKKCISLAYLPFGNKWKDQVTDSSDLLILEKNQKRHKVFFLFVLAAILIINILIFAI